MNLSRYLVISLLLFVWLWNDKNMCGVCALVKVLI